LTAGELYPLVTANAASILRLNAGQGTIREGGVADLVAVADTGQTPAEALANLRPELVMVRGRVMLASNRFAADACPRFKGSRSNASRANSDRGPRDVYDPRQRTAFARRGPWRLEPSCGSQENAYVSEPRSRPAADSDSESPQPLQLPMCDV
jgi:hypothetical protein